MSDKIDVEFWMVPEVHQNGSPITILKLDVRPPATCAVVLILDLSDSCATMQTEITRLPRLFERLPRNWPLWIYRLSDTEPLQASAVVAHLCDGSLDVMAWAGDQRLAERSRATGSYLRPPMESIVTRAIRESHSRVKILLLTDGELLDIESVEVPPNIELVGLTAIRNAARQAHWNRVVPKSRLCVLSDLSLEECFHEDQCSFYGTCCLEMQPLQSFKPILQFDTRVGSTTEIESEVLNWNFMDGPLLLRVACPSARLAECDLTLTSLRTKDALRLRPQVASEAEISALEVSGFADESTNEVDTLFEVGTQDEDFQVAWQSFCDALRTADDRKSWTDASGQLLVFRDPVFRDCLWKDEWKPISDGWLCISNTDPGAQPTSETRMAVLGLWRGRRPTLKWREDEEWWFAKVGQAMQIEFNPMENRWMLKVGSDKPRELNPRGSQVLPVTNRIDGLIWVGLFSGSLR